MIGEFDYDSLFFGEDSENHSLAILPYRTVTLIFFLAFMLIVPIIIMNLLVIKPVVSIGLFFIYFVSFLYNGVYFLWFIFNFFLCVL